jgi:hypothetical protein
VAPAAVVLSRDEAFDVLAAIDDAHALLITTDHLVVALEVEDASTLMWARLYPAGS